VFGKQSFQFLKDSLHFRIVGGGSFGTKLSNPIIDGTSFHHFLSVFFNYREYNTAPSVV
jgi:hypothetical protein